VPKDIGESFVNRARCRRDRDGYILIVAMYAAADVAAVGAIPVPVFRRPGRRSDMRHPASRPQSSNSMYIRCVRGRYDTGVCRGWHQRTTWNEVRRPVLSLFSFFEHGGDYTTTQLRPFSATLPRFRLREGGLRKKVKLCSCVRAVWGFATEWGHGVGQAGAGVLGHG
jgi:hypothetical protein